MVLTCAEREYTAALSFVSYEHVVSFWVVFDLSLEVIDGFSGRIRYGFSFLYEAYIGETDERVENYMKV